MTETQKINEAPCPKCNTTESMYIIIGYAVKPLGTWSLAGTQMKAMVQNTREARPILKCHNCTLSLVGEFDGGSHAVFTPPSKEGHDVPASDTTNAPAT